MTNILNQSNLIKADNYGKNGGCYFNCWGGALYILNQRKVLNWVNRAIMTKFLNEKTVIVSKKEKGNILCLYLCDRLEHTAVYINEGMLWHKQGQNVSEFTTEEEIKDTYPHDFIEIRKIK